MKKLIILLILLFALPAYGQVQLARMNPAMMSGSGTSAPAGLTYIYSGDGTYESTATVGNTSGRGGVVVVAAGHTFTEVGVYLTSVGTSTEGKIAIYNEFGTSRLVDGGTFTPQVGWNSKTISYEASIASYLICVEVNTTDGAGGIDTGSNGRYITSVSYATFPEASPADHGDQTNENLQVRLGY